MDGVELSTQSIFNIIEERKETPRVFGWSVGEVVHENTDVICEGTLLTAEGKGGQSASRYVLTLQGLYKCKVRVRAILAGQQGNRYSLSTHGQPASRRV